MHYGNIAMWQGYSWITAEQLCIKNSEYNYTMAIHPCNSRNTLLLPRCSCVAAKRDTRVRNSSALVHLHSNWDVQLHVCDNSNYATALQKDMTQCSYAAMTPCRYDTMQPCSYAASSYAAMTPCRYDTMQPCSYAAVQLCSHAASSYDTRLRNSSAAVDLHSYNWDVQLHVCNNSNYATALQEDMTQCSYAAMTPCRYDTMQPCSYAAMQLCSYDTMQLWHHAAVQLCSWQLWHTAAMWLQKLLLQYIRIATILPYSYKYAITTTLMLQRCNRIWPNAAMQLCIYDTLQIWHSAAMQPCSYAATQPCSYAFMQLCQYAAMQLWHHAAMTPCSYAATQLCTYAASSYAAMTPCRYDTMQPCSYAAMTPCSYAAGSYYTLQLRGHNSCCCNTCV